MRFHQLIFFFSFALLLQRGATCTSTMTDGFSLELLHPDNPHSPFYQSHPNASLLVTPLWVNPPIKRSNKYHLVSIGLGNPSRIQKLRFVTGSTLSWTRCHDIRAGEPSSSQTNRPWFNPVNSSSYGKVSCRNPICRPPMFSCVNDECIYEQRYEDDEGSHFSRGVLSTELLKSANRTGHRSYIKDFVFGCSRHESDVGFDSLSAGILGMGAFGVSLFKQLIVQRFSYCLSSDPNIITHLRFGVDTLEPPSGEDTAEVTLKVSPWPHSYYVHLLDISVRDHPLDLQHPTLGYHASAGGLIIDTGFEYSYLVRPIYDKVTRAMAAYLERNHVERVARGRGELDFCYYHKQGFWGYPGLSFHLEDGSEFDIPGTEAFLRKDGVYCLGILPSSERNILGYRLQEDVHFRYKLRGMKLEFGPADCGVV